MSTEVGDVVDIVEVVVVCEVGEREGIGDFGV